MMSEVCGWETVQVEPKVGGKFSIYGGAVEATFTTLQEPTADRHGLALRELARWQCLKGMGGAMR